MGILFYATALLTNAWLCDDAYITYRSIDNFVSGYGPVWNSGERVQSYTHPLWFFVLSAAYFITGEMYYTALIVSAIASLVAVVILAFFIAPSWRNALLGIALLINSKAFVDYSTSGLENPLTHLLAALFVWLYLLYPPSNRRLFFLSLLASLAILNRMDTALLFFPTLLFAYAERRSLRATVLMACGFVPFIAWEVFSIVYYGFPFPNTAYAKLGTGIPVEELLLQGAHYFANSLLIDPLTLSAISIGMAYMLWKHQRAHWPIVLGIALYLLYVLRIGGDFMSGRFLAAPLFFAALLLTSGELWKKNGAWASSLALIFFVGLLAPHAPLRSDSSYGLDRDDIIDDHSIADERAAYYAHTGLLNALRSPAAFPNHGWADWGRRLREFADGGIPAVVTWPYVGFAGFYAGPACHFLDIFGLADPLTARLPMRYEKDWRIGHFDRILPAGYLETHLYGRNLIEDTRLATYYDKLQIVIQGELFTNERWREIWRMNTGHYDDLVDREHYKHPPAEDVARTNHIALELPITFKPDRFEYYSGLGDLYYQRQQYALAIEQYKGAVKLGHQHVQKLHPNDYQQKLRHLYLHLARTLVALGENFSARTVLQTYLQIFNEDPIIADELDRLSL
jgi:arabinofuranosyltransferase